MFEAFSCRLKVVQKFYQDFMLLVHRMVSLHLVLQLLVTFSLSYDFSKAQEGIKLIDIRAYTVTEEVSNCVVYYQFDNIYRLSSLKF